MRSTTPLLRTLAILATLAGCGTKTPLTLPPPQPPAKASMNSMPLHQEGTMHLALADDQGAVRGGAAR